MSTAKTCIQDGITLSGEQITEQLYKTNQQLIPAPFAVRHKLKVEGELDNISLSWS
jgi:hypothetical protein